MQELWASREKPTALDLDAVLAGGGNGGAEANGAALAHSNGAAAELGASACRALGLTDQHRVWSVRESAQVRGPGSTLPTLHVSPPGAPAVPPHARGRCMLWGSKLELLTVNARKELVVCAPLQAGLSS